MFRKKLIALVLVGIITFGATVSNTSIVLASSTKAKASDNMMKGMLYCEMDRLEKFINQRNYETAISLQKNLKNHLKILSDIGHYTKDLQKEFDRLSKQINLLKSKNEKIHILEEKINSSIENIYSKLNNKDYKDIPDKFKSLSKYIDKLSKYKAINKPVHDAVAKLKDRYNNRKKIDKTENIIELIVPQLDNLSNLIKEKNIHEAILIRKEVYSYIQKLDKLSDVPSSIAYTFNLYSDELYKLIYHGKEALRL